MEEEGSLMLDEEGSLNLSIYEINKVEGISEHGLNAVDLKKILTKLSSGRERRSRKCRKVENRGLNAILSELPPPFPLKRLYLSGNERIGDDGMDHLHLIPESVTELIVPICGITAKGIKTLCDFLGTRQTIEKLYLCGNDFGDEGALHIANMLRVNDSLRFISLGCNAIGQAGFEYISSALGVNETLHGMEWCMRDVEDDDGVVPDETVQAFCEGLSQNRGLDSVNLMVNPDVDAPFTSVGLEHFKECLRSNLRLTNFYPFKKIKRKAPPEKTPCEVSFLLTLNNVNRKIIRDPDATLSDWLECLIRTSKAERVDFSFFFLRNKPELCMLSRAPNS